MEKMLEFISIALLILMALITLAVVMTWLTAVIAAIHEAREESHE